MNKYDIAVIGGGMVGAAVAVGFAKQGRSVVVVEGAEPKAFEISQALDVRVSAISHQSVKLLDSLGAWSAIESMRVCPYRRLETWEHPECRTRFHSDELSLEQLGYIVENRLIQLGLWQAFAQHDNLTVMCPERLKDIEFADVNRVTLESGEQFEANWVIGACMLINVKTELPQQDITWQQFTPSGPRSFLPLCSLIEDGQEVGQGSLVWYDSPKRIKQLCAMTKPQLREEILRHFPAELGDIEVLQFGSFPLTRRHAQSYSNKNCVLVGDSAHTINPLAGQGVNLGFKDVDVLLAVTEQQEQLNDALLAKYERARRPDNLLMQTGMDVFYKGFSNDLGPLKFARNAALKLAENSGPIKAQVLKYALGM
ncbi:2-octaprenyl-3-methyl-6-methoxy-1,4-benzoquinol hydroxylase [Vibrio campbellii]|uniref:2-octaprenyl-3-methyl-6-methoxy-1,4-benzoquinol hydroxylase n=1 Tax=Vibrio campbellii TaxID=680 RepID=UPI00142E31E7|nr:2-octaprenyl-3-methyl-6-methoxy-1,4-benzoquinol hydroxylase [Vibrio campbellii]NIY87633.1 NAD(P)-binding domain-containing protein [Vibrio campbellii]